MKTRGSHRAKSSKVSLKGRAFSIQGSTQGQDLFYFKPLVGVTISLKHSYLSLQRMNAVFACWGKGRLEVLTKQAFCNSLLEGLVIGSWLWLRLGRLEP